MKYKYTVQTLIIFLSIGCTAFPDKSEALYGTGCKIWWLYDENISEGPTPLFICFNKDKYRCHMVTRFGTLIRPAGDTVYGLTESGQWSILNDSLYLQNMVFSEIKINRDTIYLGPARFLVDATKKFNINNCDCDSLDVQFKGGKIKSFKEVLSLQN